MSGEVSGGFELEPGGEGGDKGREYSLESLGREQEFLRDLIERTGYVETEPVKAAGEQVIEALRGDGGVTDRVITLLSRYQIGQEEIVKKYTSRELPQAYIGVLLTRARLWDAAGDVESREEDVEDAWRYAEEIGDWKLCRTLEGRAELRKSREW